MTNTTTKNIAALNDQFRKKLCHPFEGERIPGTFFITPGIVNLSQEDLMVIQAEVCGFDTFTNDNDPYKEHDFGAFDFKGEKIFWKIDYYADSKCEYGSENPEDPEKTFRVLTIYLASEH